MFKLAEFPMRYSRLKLKLDQWKKTGCHRLRLNEKGRLSAPLFVRLNGTPGFPKRARPSSVTR